MKRIINNIITAIAILGFLVPGLAHAQNVPGGARATATAVPKPGAYTTNSINYIRTWEPDAPLNSSGEVMDPTRLVKEVKQRTQYFDGLGRPVQEVVKGNSGNGKDLVMPVVYDQYGREQYKYLPYAQQTANDGKFKIDPFNAQSSFYSTAALNPGLPGESIFYNKTDFEPSPLNRQLKAYAPGNSWTTRPIENRYEINATADSVRIWTVATGLPQSSGFYAPGQLLKQINIDQQQNQVIEYKNKENQTILKKVQISDAPSTGHAGWLCTYYIYDDIGNLRYVISPLGVENIKSNWTITAAVDTGLCFQYQYDTRKRMIVKRTPGSGPVFMVYDNRDRLVFTQDSVQRAKSPMEWLVTYHDDLNRPIMTAIYKNTVTRESLQNTFNTVSSTPTLPEATLTPLSYSYYDNYEYAGKQAFVATDTAKLPADFGQYQDRLPLSNMVYGQITGTKIRVLGTEKWLITTIYYNDKGRLLQMISDNNMGGKDIVTNSYSFKGTVLATHLRHQNPKSAISQTTLLTTMTYDQAGRLLTVRKRLNDNINLERTIVSNSYDELGMLKVKRLGSPSASSNAFIDSLTYTYNIRGWLQGINREFANSSNSTTNWFGQELSYDYGFTSNQFNGNIAGVKWKSRSDSAWAYGYSYDRANRLTSAYFTQKNGSSWAQDKKDFSVSNLTYDPNGNIKSMWQKGMIGTKSQIIDSLNYTYPTNSNRLLAVSDIDSSRTKSAKLGDFIDGNKSGKDYTYDANGNIVGDMNRQIRYITYNHLNLPEEVSIIGKGKINYQYDATGRKLSKTVSDSSGTTPKTIVTDYDQLFVYRQDSLELISHDDGRIRAVYKAGDSVRYAYDYFEKDHLGNIRTILTDQTDLTMYAATMEMEAAATETALFNNIEETRAEKPVGYPEDQTTTENKSVAKLNAKDGGKKIGPSLVLRVMAGDSVQVFAKAFYKSQGPTDNDFKAPAEDMLADLIRVFGGTGPNTGIHSTDEVVNVTPFNESFYNNDYQRLKEKDQDNTQVERPKAYLNFVLFDDNFELVEGNSGVRQVKQDPDQLQQLDVQKMPIEKSGFLYVYTSNESQQDVFFDNVVALVSSGPLLEETHYYPYGLAMVGIGSNALKGSSYRENRRKYNGNELQSKEFADGSGLELYDFNARTYDPQTGRFLSTDPATDLAREWSGYRFGFDNPVLNSDPSGLWEGTYRPGDAGFNEIIESWNANNFNVNEGDDDKDKGKGKANAQTKTAFFPALPALGGEYALAGAAAALKGPSLDDWAAALNGLQYDWQHSLSAELIAYLYAYFSAPNAQPVVVVATPVVSHGNDKNNPNPHIVYEIFGYGIDPKTHQFGRVVLKYGIAEQKWNTPSNGGNSRPRGQLDELRNLYPHLAIGYQILHETPDRLTALGVEQLHVWWHYIVKGYVPPEQHRPLPAPLP